MGGRSTPAGRDVHRSASTIRAVAGVPSPRCRAHGLQADGSDLQSIAGCKVQDVFTITEMHDNRIANPPYGLAEEAIRYLLPLTRYKLAFLLRTNFLHSIRRSTFYATMPFARMWVLSRRPSCPPGIYQGVRDNHGCLIQPEEPAARWIIPGSSSSTAIPALDRRPSGMTHSRPARGHAANLCAVALPRRAVRADCRRRGARIARSYPAPRVIYSRRK